MVQTEAHAGLPEKESGRVYIGVLHTHGAVARERHVLANGQISLSRPDELGRFRAIAAEWDLKSGYLDLLIVTGGGGFVQGIPFAETYREWLIQRNNNPEKIFAVTTGSETRSDMIAAARSIKNALKLPMS